MSMAFSPTSGLRDTVTYTRLPVSETAAREQIQGRLDEVRDYVNKHGVFLSDTGGVNASAVTLPVALTASTGLYDMQLFVKMAATNTSTGTPTMTVASSSGTIATANIVRESTTPLLAGDLKSGNISILQYDSSSTEWKLINPVNSQLSLISTAAGDILYATAVNTLDNLAIGSSGQVLTASSSGFPTWSASPATIMTAQGDILYASAANTPARLAKGTALQTLAMNATTTAPEWQASPQSVMTAQGDILYASAANTLARLGKGTAGQALVMNATTTAPEWANQGVGVNKISNTFLSEASTAITFTGISSDYYRFDLQMNLVPSSTFLIVTINSLTAGYVTRYQSSTEVGLNVSALTSGWEIHNVVTYTADPGEFPFMVNMSISNSSYLNKAMNYVLSGTTCIYNSFGYKSGTTGVTISSISIDSGNSSQPLLPNSQIMLLGYR